MTASSPGLKNPFPGLRPFEEEESDLFFGRETQSDELLNRLGRTRFVAVVGTSGSGKSSLVRAGLLPALVGGFLTDAGSHWRIAVFRPGADPIGRLRDALHGAFPAAPDPDEERFRLDMLETSLRRSSLGLVDAARQARLAAFENVLVVVDQFEELFRFGRVSASGGEDQAALVRLLLQAIGQREISIHVMITMRSDFLGDCAQFPDLPETINDGLYLIPRMKRDQLRKAITGPAAVTGTGMTPRLVQQLLNDVGGDPDQLPILQHALMRMWDRESRKPGTDKLIDLEDYEAIGGMTDALSRHANESWDQLPDERSRELARRMFQCLTEKGPDNREVRRPTTLGQICGILETDGPTMEGIVNHFRAGGRAFLMPPSPTPLDPYTVIDISHESLIRKWDKLRLWVAEEADSASEYLRVAEAAQLNRAGRLGFWSNPELQVALNWKQKTRPTQAWAERHAPGFAVAMDFLERSVEDEKATAEREAKARRAEKMGWWLAGLAVFLISVSAVFGGLLFRNRKLLEETRAIRGAVQAALLARQKDSALAESLQLAVASMRLSRSADSDEVMRNDLALLPRQLFSRDHGKKVTSVAFSPDGKYLATGSEDKTVAVLDAGSGVEISHLTNDVGGVSAIAFGPDGHSLAAGYSDGKVRVMEASTGKETVSAFWHKGDVVAVAFSPDGRFLATGSTDKTARVVETAGGRELFSVTHKDAVNAVMFSPNSRFLATASSDKTARVVDVATRREIFHATHQAVVQALAFSPKGRYLASASADKTVHVTVAATGKEIARITHQDKVLSVAFSPDERYLATGSADQTARVVVAETAEEVSRLKHQGRVRVVAFSPDGRFIATASDDNTARIMEALTGHEVSRFPHEGDVFTVAFHPSGRYVATGSADGKARVFEASTGKDVSHIPLADRAFAVAFSQDERYAAIGEAHQARIIDLKDGRVVSTIPHSDSIFAVAFSPDGRYLAAGGADGTVRVVDREGGGVHQVARTLHQDPVNAVAFSPDGRRLAMASADGTARVIEWSSGKTLLEFHHLLPANAVAFSQNGRFLATASDDKTVAVLEAAGGRTVARYSQQDAVMAVAFSPDGKNLATGSVDNTARVIDAQTGKELFRLNHLDWVYAVAFSPDGRYLATASKDKTVLILEQATGRRLSRITHEDAVMAVTFSQDGNILRSFSGDTFSRHVVQPQDLIDEACARLTRNLTHEEWDEFFPELSYRKTCPNLPVP